MTELLAVFGILTILSVVTMTATRKMQMVGKRADSLATLRNLGTGLHQYAADHQTLPGPLWSTQDPKYTGSPGFLVTSLWPYMQPEKPETGTIPAWAAPKHWRTWAGKQTNRPRNISVARAVDLEDGGTLDPFGAASDGGGKDRPVANWTLFSSSVKLSETRALWDIFSTSSASDRAPKRLLQDYTATLFFDGHAITEDF